jgi:hypothetical protein
VRRGYAAPYIGILILGFALGSAYGLNKRAEPKPSAKPETLKSLDGAAEPRLTSGGEAVETYRNDSSYRASFISLSKT